MDELNRRLAEVEADPTLLRHPAEARLIDAGPLLCSDSTPPLYRWRYEWRKDFEPVHAFYDEVLQEAGWRRGDAVSNVVYEKDFGDWTAVADVDIGGSAFVVTVRVDDGYESGC